MCFLDLECIKENPYKNAWSTGFYTNSQYMLTMGNFKLLQDHRWQTERLAQFAQGDNQVHVKQMSYKPSKFSIELILF